MDANSTPAPATLLAVATEALDEALVGCDYDAELLLQDAAEAARETATEYATDEEKLANEARDTWDALLAVVADEYGDEAATDLAGWAAVIAAR